MSQYDLSIIVPSYNIEEYILRCLESLNNVSKEFSQRFEVLVINDGGTDSTSTLAKQFSRESVIDIRVIDKENGGHGSTINCGVKEACGKYIKIIDGDDWVNQGDFEKLLSQLRTETADLVVTDFTTQYAYNGTSEHVAGLRGKEASIKTLEDIDFMIQMHAITYKKSVLEHPDCQLSEHVFYVDIQYNLFPMKYVKTIAYYPYDVYQYFIGRPAQSVSLQSYVKNINHQYIVLESLFKFKLANTLSLRLQHIINHTIDMFVNKLLVCGYLADDDKHLDRLIDLMATYQYDYQYQWHRKLGALIYRHYHAARPVQWLIRPFISFKLNKLIKQDRLY